MPPLTPERTTEMISPRRVICAALAALTLAGIALAASPASASRRRDRREVRIYRREARRLEANDRRAAAARQRRMDRRQRRINQINRRRGRVAFGYSTPQTRRRYGQ
jgi:hypothetical protein